MEHIVIERRRAILVKEDTIAYRVESFINGDERKLREVLKKLPGVEVDRQGNVRVNGRKVQKLLVEGRVFFTGDSKLGVNNIPSNVIDEIEILSNYNENPILREILDSNTLALNVKLKEDKKNFIFGDLVAGYGYEDRYVLNPKLFRYGSKTNINLIGDINNIGEKTFTFQDYLSYEGGNSLLLLDPVAYSKILNNDFVSSLQNNDFLNREDYFGAINIDHNSSSKFDFNIFSITNYSLTDRKLLNQLRFVTNNDLDLRENRFTSSLEENFFTLNKLQLNYIPSSDSKLSYQLILKATNGIGETNITSISQDRSKFVEQNLKPSSVQLSNQIIWDKRFSQKHTGSALVSFEFINSNDRNRWRFTDPGFTNIFINDGDSPFTVDQYLHSKILKGGLALKHYWALNNTNHIYTAIGFSNLKEEFSSEDQEILNNNTNSLENLGFNNETKLFLSDPYIGLEYKTKISKLVIRSGLYYHYYILNIRQFEDKISSLSKPQLIPEIDINWKFSNSERLNMNYTYKSSFGGASQFANRIRFLKFNELFQGNEKLENNLAHQFLISYHKSNLSNGLFYNASLNYRIQAKGVRNSSIFEGVNQISTLIYNDLPENNFLLNASVSKLIGKFKCSLGSNLLISNYSKLINDDINLLKASNLGVRFNLESFFKGSPNFELGLSTDFTNATTSSEKNAFQRTAPFLNFTYRFFNDFLFTGEYTYTIYTSNGQNIRNEFQIGSASVFYTQEDSAWGFELDVNNLFDVRFKNESLISSFVVGDTQTFIQPRTILIKINYKL